MRIRRYIRSFSFCLVSALLLATTGMADLSYASGAWWEANYRVIDVRGEVLAWPPMQLGWQDVTEGELLAEGTVLQFRSGSVIVLRDIARPRELGVSGRDLRLRGESDMVVRLEPSILREFQMKSLHIDAGKESEASLLGGKGTDIFVNQAWKRVAGIFSDIEGLLRKERLSSSPKGSESKGGGEVRTSAARTILVSSPLRGSVVIADTLPVAVAVVWETKQDMVEPFKVELWPAKRRVSKTVMDASGGSAVIEIPRVGRWALQVSTADSAWLSSVIPILVVIPGAELPVDPEFEDDTDPATDPDGSSSKTGSPAN